MADLRALSAPEMEGRLAGSAGGRRARQHILTRFRRLGLQPVGKSYEQTFPLGGGEAAPSLASFGTNVMGLVRGSGQSGPLVIVSAHYDHVGIRNGQLYPGADDNASGVAAMLAVAEWFAERPPRGSVLFVAFDAEEQGLRGAEYFVRHPPVDLRTVTAIVNLDMVGRGESNAIGVAGTSYSPSLRPIVTDAARGRGLTIVFGYDRAAGARPEQDWTHASDHGPFHDAGVPFLYFGVENHKDYHQPTDTPERIPRGFFTAMTEVVLETVRLLAGGGIMTTVRPRTRAMRYRFGIACLVLAALALAAPGAGQRPSAAAGSEQLSPDEQAIVARVDAGNADALALLERVVNINSGSMNLAGVREVGDVFRKELDALGFQTTWIDGAPFKRAGHLVAERPGRGPRVILIGHLDTVFEADSPFQRFERLHERTARGPGIIDMKGGDVVMLFALRALHATGSLNGLHVTVVLTGDEELTGEPLAAARQALVAASRGADVALGFENGPGDPRMAVIARRGTTRWRLDVQGKPAHSSQIFRGDIGAGAIYEAARILQVFRETLAGEPHLTFNPGVMLGGTDVDLDAPQARGTAFGKENVIAGHAVVMGDVRTLSAEQLERTKERMHAIAARSLPHTSARLTFEAGYPPLAPTDGNRRLLALYDQASRDIGAGPVGAVDPDRAGAADVSFIAGEVGMILDGIGLMGHSDHTPQETADLTTLPSQTKRAAILLHRLAQGAAR